MSVSLLFCKNCIAASMCLPTDIIVSVFVDNVKNVVIIFLGHKIGFVLCKCERVLLIRSGYIYKASTKNILIAAFIFYSLFMYMISRQVLIRLIRPYTRITISFISRELNIPSAEVESLLVSCILDNTINGRIDQVRFVYCSYKWLSKLMF